MKNETVEQLIERLKKMNPKAVVGRMDLESIDEPMFSTFEICREHKNVEYIDDAGDIKKGDVVAFY